MTGDGPDSVAITQRELLLEMRADIKALGSTVDSLAKDAALNVERRASAQASSDRLAASVAEHERELDDLRRWRDRADGAMTLARWALGASLVSLVAVALQLAAALSQRPS